MKNTLYIFSLLIAFTACSKDVLDKQPLDIITDKVVWNDPILIESYLTQCYSQMYIMTNEVPSWDDYNNELWTRWSDINGIADEGKNQWASTVQPYKNGGLQIGGGLLEWWENSYYVIRKLNEFIERLPSSPIAEDIKNIRLSEARFLRAYSYFSMVKRYGGVPLIKRAQGLDDPDLYPARATEQEVYDYVISELDAISKILPESMPTGRPNKYAALAMEARAALYAGSIAKYGIVQLNGVLGIPANKSTEYFSKAYEICNTIITAGKYTLYSKNSDKVKNFRQLFLEKGNSEVIFVRPHTYTDANAGGNGWSYDFFQCPAPQAWGGGNQDGPYLEMAEEFEHVDGSSGKLNRAAITTGLWTLEQLWGNKDPRFYATIYTHGTAWKGTTLDWHNGIKKTNGVIQTDGSYQGILAKGSQLISNGFGAATCFGVMKYLDENKDNFTMRNGSGTDWIVLRYGEVLLNFAEAAIELTKSGDALWAVNKIRERAGIAQLLTVDLDKIRHERKVELAFEGHRYWDVRRWRIATTVLSKNNSGLRYILDYTTRKLQLQIIDKIDGTVSSPAFYDYNYYLPIGLTRTGNNPNLVENPGY